MSLPNYLANIKSSGFYRFVWDKSIIQPQQAETLRILVGYSEKGPFNTPVYLETPADLISTYGNISKKMERKGIFFHRSCIQALSSGPILALNLKPFTTEQVSVLKYNPANVYGISPDLSIMKTDVKNAYDTNRFWYIDSEKLPQRVNSDKYVTIITTDNKDQSCSLFIRKYVPKSYDLTIRQWFANESSEEMPSYLEAIQDNKLSEYFAEIYVFKGKFTKELCGEGGALSKYFDVAGDEITIKSSLENIYGEQVDALEQLSNNSSSNFIAKYQGCVIPYFKDANGSYNSLDIIFNADNYKHKLLMKLDESILEDSDDINSIIACTETVGKQYYELHVIGKEYVESDEIEGADDYVVLESLPSTEGNPAGLPLYVTVGEENYKLEVKYGYVWTGSLSDDQKGQAVDKTTGGVPVDATSASEKYIYIDGGAMPVKPIYIEGYTYVTIEKSDKDQILQDKILNVLNEKGIRTALTNRVDVEYHYLVDTFDSYVGLGCKAKLSQIAKEKDNAFALLNVPTMSKFVDDDLGRFNTNGVFDMEKLANASNGFSLAGEDEGASWCAYFTQLITSDGTLKSNIPSAALVSNKFMDKYNGRQPYYIVAGYNYGTITYSGIVGPDYNYGRSDLDVLEPLGINAIIYVPRKGTYINSNQTAKQIPVSALSKIHIRELVIYLQNEIEYMLQNYQWELNTQTLRDTIKSKADYILENIKNNGGIYEYECVCDETNNTPEVIDNEMVVLDIAIEPGRGCGKMVQSLSIHKTGGISSQG